MMNHHTFHAKFGALVARFDFQAQYQMCACHEIKANHISSLNNVRSSYIIYFNLQKLSIIHIYSNSYSSNNSQDSHENLTFVHGPIMA